MTERDRSPYVGSLTDRDISWLWAERERERLKSTCDNPACGLRLYWLRDGTEWCPQCGHRIMPRQALVPVPGGSRYGLLTVRMVYQYRLWAEGWLDGVGWARINTHRYGLRSPWAAPVPGYADLRDALLGFVDLPEELAGLIALWLTRDSATQFWLSFTVVL